jgi:hypothetical protein
VKEKPSTSDYEPEPPRSRTIPDDFIWVPELQGWIAPGTPSQYSKEEVLAYEEAEWEEKRRQWQEAQRLKSTDPASAARDLDVPLSSRKSLHAGVKREHLPLFPDDDT